MGQSKLFDDIRRSDSAAAPRTEAIASYLNRSARSDVEGVRVLLESWYAELPADVQPGFKSRLRSARHDQFMPAFWELYLHAVHLRLGFSVEYEPDLPGVSARPDFRFSRNGSTFLLEATVIDIPEAENRRRKREAVLLDKIDEVSSPDFFLAIEIVESGEEIPSRAELAEPLEAWLASLDWEAESCRSQESAPTVFLIEARGWKMTFEPIPRSKSRGDGSGPTIGIGPSFAGVFSENLRIKEQLRAKASKYGKPDCPIVIAILCLAEFADEADIEQALFGPEVIAFSAQRRSAGSVLKRDPDGLWQRGNDKRATRVTAVLSAKSIRPWSVLEELPVIWHNPWAANALAADLPWRAVRGNRESKLLDTEEAGLTAEELFDLPSGWPQSATDSSLSSTNN